ncbi:MAG: HAD family hydrolase [Kiritimatiellaeota bacterium]|nr:HAD family hydrolase [Kiritimatiellota bacterium]
MDVFILDFDGVLCDSAAETGVSAWRTGVRLWPEWQGEEPPPDVLVRFIRLRPVLETGYQAPLLMRLAWNGMDEQEVFRRFPTLCEELIRELGLTRRELVRIFGRVRDDWLASAPEDWRSRHRFYPGVRERVAAVAVRNRVFVLTTKQTRFAVSLLEAGGFDIPRRNVFGMDVGRPKEAVLEELISRHGLAGARFHFVEDRLKTLERVAALPKLDAVELYLAGWGYVTPAELDRAAGLSRIRVWGLADFLSDLQPGRPTADGVCLDGAPRSNGTGTGAA